MKHFKELSFSLCAILQRLAVKQLLMMLSTEFGNKKSF